MDDRESDFYEQMLRACQTSQVIRANLWQSVWFGLIS